VIAVRGISPKMSRSFHAHSRIGAALMTSCGGTLIATLPAGNYALVCNIAKHYGLGMRAGLTVS
jgi:hypothetical protein